MVKMEDDNYVSLDVSGTVFKLHKLLLTRFPNALLAKLVEALNHNSSSSPSSMIPQEFTIIEEKNKFFVQRSPFLFEIILQAYVSGKLHVPYWMCKQHVIQEIKFWKLNPNEDCCDCCSDHNVNEEKNDLIDMNEVDFAKATEWQKMKYKLWIFFEQTGSSRCALIYAIITMAFVFISIANMVLSSVPVFQFCPVNGTSILTASEVTKIGTVLGGMTNDTDSESELRNETIVMKPEGVLRFFSNCWGMQVSELVEMICIAWFTIEFILRFLCCSDRWRFMKSALNIVDFCATFRYYMELALWGMGFDNGSTLILIFRIIRTVSVLRILKLARYHEDLRILGETLLSAQKEISMLLVFMLVTLLVYSCLVFQLEKDVVGTQFVSIPQSLWWAIVTLTTVGYGDIYPTTPLGKMIGALTCVTGILIIGLPMSILVDTFTTKYRKKSSLLFSSNIPQSFPKRRGLKFT